VNSLDEVVRDLEFVWLKFKNIFCFFFFFFFLNGTYMIHLLLVLSLPSDVI
jgi:hypothetical protein